MYIMHKVVTGHTKYADKKRTSPARTLICVGSGGHTSEMLALTQSLDVRRYHPRYYILANTDKTSLVKIHKQEILSDGREGIDYNIKVIPRSRNVDQSYLSSILTTLRSVLSSVPLVVRIKPDVILCNGPGTCVPICLVAFILKVALVCNSKIVFVESFCRTRTFSLSGKILMYVADNVLVQWPSLKKKLKRSDYIGQLM